MSLLFAGGDPTSGFTVIIEQAAAAGGWSDGGNFLEIMTDTMLSSSSFREQSLPSVWCRVIASYQQQMRGSLCSPG